jgi:hypothetical protein
LKSLSDVSVKGENWGRKVLESPREYMGDIPDTRKDVPTLAIADQDFPIPLATIATERSSTGDEQTLERWPVATTLLAA